jgi:hypothetical protein
VLEWLLDNDPSIRWQVLRDVVAAPPAEVAAERDRVATTGWGGRLMSAQDADGRWGAGLYSSKWTSTTYTLLLLHWLGIPPGNDQTLAGCRALCDGASSWDGGLTLAKTICQPEVCITGMLVLIASSFGCRGERVDESVGWLLAHQLDDGGWNCDSVRRGSRHGSFHTSITVLDALTAYQGGPLPVDRAMDGAREFFLRHHLYWFAMKDSGPSRWATLRCLRVLRWWNEQSR